MSDPDAPLGPIGLSQRAGAATATFSLLRLIVERQAPDGRVPGSPVRDLFDRLRGKWDSYNA